MIPDSIFRPDDVPKTVLTTPVGLFEFVRMPLELRNVAQMFEHLIDQVLRGTTSAYAYIDDVLIASPTSEQHLKDVEPFSNALAPMESFSTPLWRSGTRFIRSSN